MDRMAAEATSWVVGPTAAEAAMDGRLLAAATAWAPEPTRSTAAGIDMTIGARIGTAITGTPIGTALTGPTVAPAGLACGHRMDGKAGGCAHRTATATADIGTAGTAAIMARPMGVAKAVTEPNDKFGPRLSGTPAGEPSFNAASEQFTIVLDKAGPDACTLHLDWEATRASIGVREAK